MKEEKGVPLADMRSVESCSVWRVMMLVSTAEPVNPCDKTPTLNRQNTYSFFPPIKVLFPIFI